uniref:Uncharacterized protein n=1 Tax=Peromyscus maniculatus bairdii TaxID=230844 RepID=A0A8C8UQK3_PERMB
MKNITKLDENPSLPCFMNLCLVFSVCSHSAHKCVFCPFLFYLMKNYNSFTHNYVHKVLKSNPETQLGVSLSGRVLICCARHSGFGPLNPM